MNTALVQDILEYTRDGEWGKGEPGSGLVAMGVIRGTDFDRVRYGDLSTIPVRYIPEKIAARKTLRPGDVLFETAGGTKDQPTGRSVFLHERIFESYPLPLTCASFSRFLRPDPALIDGHFFYWFLQYLWSERHIYHYHIQHTGVARFQYTQFASEQNIPLLPYEDQREIAAILGALDDKIELNRKTAATLEEMARALYRSWFVDFDPVHAKSEGRAPAHMDAATAALFPDSFGEDGLPEGWVVRGLDQIADFLNGAALQKFPAEEGEEWLPVIKIAELRNGVTASSGRAAASIPAKYRIEDGDVLFSWSGSLMQKVWIGGRGALNQHLFKVSSAHVPRWFHYFAVDQHMEYFQGVAASKATTMGHIQRHHLSDAKVNLPSTEVMCAADNILAPIFDASIARLLENQTLATLRDTLLPRLMSGELRVGAAKELIEEVA